jgi:alginate O-acetyltransferase complex protein AlgI
MLFNSYIYLLIFLPISLLGFLLLRRAPLRVAFGWLVVASLVFYGWWNPDPLGKDPWTPFYVVLILASCIGNYFFGRYIAGHKHTPKGKAILTIGVVANLLLLGYYKYAGFLVGAFQDLTGTPHQVPHIVLPLAISFFTFLQIAYLVDAYRGETEEYHFTDYLLFVTFFPHLIAGPLVHHKEMMPQFSKRRAKGLSLDMSIGLTILVIGLFKKVVIGDNLSGVSNAFFDLAAHGGRVPSFGEAWAGSLAYALHLYFDFSGYSDMAIGSARLFGIRFPLNFHSPYKADSVVDFWRRWHMTLSRFLRDYLYIPLGGNRKGKARRYVNLLLTMILGGIWHGAGLAFLLWGLLHGLYLCANHLWFTIRKKYSWKPLPKALAIGLTFLAVLFAWVPFKAGSYEHGRDGSTATAVRATQTIYASMIGVNGFEGLPKQKTEQVIKESRVWKPILAALLAVFLLPNTQEFLRRYRPAIGMEAFEKFPGKRRWWEWRPTPLHAVLTLLLLYVVAREFDKVSEFIYFQF